MKKRISVKLFTITALFLLVLISSAMLFQILVFESYYQAKKVKDFKASFQRLHTRYLNEGPGKARDEAPAYVLEFEEKNYARAAIANIKDGAIQIALLSKIRDDRLFIMAKSKLAPEDSDPFTIPVPPLSMGRLSKTDNLVSAVYEMMIYSGKQFFNGTFALDGPVVFKSEAAPDGTENIIAAVMLSRGEEGYNYLFAVSSLQPVGEAVSVIKDLYLYFSVFALILILLLALVFSNMVSKPLVLINKTALKMADLDFTAKCAEKRNDEIGSLAHTLNFLSGNLRRALSELKTANSKLTEDIEKERQLEKMRKEFVAGVSHELKTPVSLITGYAEGLRENLVEGLDKDHYIDVISDEAYKIGNLVNDMLDLSQLESGSFKLNKGEFFIDELVSYSLKKFMNNFRQKNIRIEYNLPEKNMLVYADEFRIEQVINNFVNNAIRHTPENGIIRVNLVEMRANVRVEVENEGSHIDEEELDNIWQKFYKVEKSRNRENSGTGLGLAIVKNILTLHGSKYGAVNTGSGVMFYFDLSLMSS